MDVAKQIMNFDDSVFGQIASPTYKDHKPPYYGEFYVQNIDYTAKFNVSLMNFNVGSMYDIVVLANTTS